MVIDIIYIYQKSGINITYKCSISDFKGYAKPLIINTQNHSYVCINSSCGVPQGPRNNTDGSVVSVKNTKKSKSYHVSNFKTDFLSAHQWCFEYDMKLASIMSNEESEKYINTTKLPSKLLNYKMMTYTGY